MVWRGPAAPAKPSIDRLLLLSNGLLGFQLPGAVVGGVLDVGGIADGVALLIESDVAGHAVVGDAGQRSLDSGGIGGAGGLQPMAVTAAMVSLPPLLVRASGFSLM